MGLSRTRGVEAVAEARETSAALLLVAAAAEASAAALFSLARRRRARGGRVVVYIRRLVVVANPLEGGQTLGSPARSVCAPSLVSGLSVSWAACKGQTNEIIDVCGPNARNCGERVSFFLHLKKRESVSSSI